MPFHSFLIYPIYLHVIYTWQMQMTADPTNFSLLIFMPNNFFGHGQKESETVFNKYKRDFGGTSLALCDDCGCTPFVRQMCPRCARLAELTPYAETPWVMHCLAHLEESGGSVTEGLNTKHM